jgi:hypothetical protein
VVSDAANSAAMSVTVLCPNLACRAILRVPDRTRGKKVRCGQCGMALLIPSNPGSSPSEKVKPEAAAADVPPKAKS